MIVSREVGMTSAGTRPDGCFAWGIRRADRPRRAQTSLADADVRRGERRHNRSPSALLAAIRLLLLLRTGGGLLLALLTLLLGLLTLALLAALALLLPRLLTLL